MKLTNDISWGRRAVAVTMILTAAALSGCRHEEVVADTGMAAVRGPIEQPAEPARPAPQPAPDAKTPQAQPATSVAITAVQ